MPQANINVYAELNKIYERDGMLQPKQVVDEARPKDSPLHPCFEWDNKLAGEKWRLQQARTLIRQADVINLSATTKTLDQPADPIVKSVNTHRPFINVPGTATEEPCYVRVDDLVKDADKTLRAITQLCIKIAALQNTVDQIKAEMDDDNLATAKLAQIAQALAVAKEIATSIH